MVGTVVVYTHVSSTQSLKLGIAPHGLLSVYLTSHDITARDEISQAFPLSVCILANIGSSEDL